MRLTLIYILATAALFGLGACSPGSGEPRGKVLGIVLLAQPQAGAIIPIELVLHDPYTRFGVDEALPRVEAGVSGGEISGLIFVRWSDEHDVYESWERVSGLSISDVLYRDMQWALPDQPGSYSISVTFDGHTKTLNVSI